MLLTKTTAIAALSLTLGAVTVIRGTNGDDDLLATEGRDIMIMFGGDDRAAGEDGDDMILLGSGNDFGVGGDGNDFLIGGRGNDLLRGGVGDDMCWGGSGDDTIQVWTGLRPLIPGLPVQCDGLDEFDIAKGGGGDDTIEWLSGVGHSALSPALRFCFESGDATFDGGGGVDVVRVGAGGFDGMSAENPIEPGDLPGYPWKVRSTLSGKTLHFRNVEVVTYLDTTVNL